VSSEHRQKSIAELEAMVATLEVQERRARTVGEANRLRAMKNEAQMRLAIEKGEARGEKPIKCPVCDQLGDFTEPHCPNCGSTLDWNALYAKVGLWKVYIVYIILFSLLAYTCGIAAIEPAYPKFIRIAAAFGSTLFLLWSVPSWIRVLGFLRWSISKERPA
jgi:hypothetical protein